MVLVVLVATPCLFAKKDERKKIGVVLVAAFEVFSWWVILGNEKIANFSAF